MSHAPTHLELWLCRREAAAPPVTPAAHFHAASDSRCCCCVCAALDDMPCTRRLGRCLHSRVRDVAGGEESVRYSGVGANSSGGDHAFFLQKRRLVLSWSKYICMYVCMYVLSVSVGSAQAHCSAESPRQACPEVNRGNVWSGEATPAVRKREAASKQASKQANKQTNKQTKTSE